jgi:phage terminase large subunit
MHSNRFFVDESCKFAIQEFETYSWDPKAQLKGEDKPMKAHDHAMDEIRYALYSHFGKGFVAYGGLDREEGKRWGSAIK